MEDPSSSNKLSSNQGKSDAINTIYFNVSFSITQNNKPRLLIDNCSDIVQSGQTLAIMGPSGAGKTALLRILTMEAHGGRTTGTLTLNGNPMTPNLFKEKCGLVAQEDYHWSFLTCRETVAYSVDLLHPTLTTDQKKNKVDDMIEKMGLTSCQNTIVGNQFIHGLSGGQKRRLSLAVALVKNLEIVFLDEPTSGLDAAAAAGIMVFLADVTKREHLITIFTVHQPSTNIFNSFDRVMLLSQGRVAYCGNQRNVPAHLQAIGHPLPPQMNPAEFLLDIVNTDFTDETEVRKILDDWDNIGKPIHDERTQNILSNMTKSPISTGRAVADSNFVIQTLILLKRHTVLSIRDPMIYTGRIFMFLVATIFFAVVYVHARIRNQDQALNRYWFITWCLGVPTNMAVIAVFVFNLEFNAIKKEVKNGMVNVIPYLIANSIIQVPVMFVLGLAALVIAGYGIINMNGKHFGQIWLIYTITLYVFEALAQVMSVQFSNPLIGMLQFVNMWFTSFLFCGLFLPIDNIVWPFRVFSYILPFRYTFQILGYQEFQGTHFRDAENCVYGASDPDCLEGGFKCDPSVSKCYGYEGTQVLTTMHNSFSLVSDQNLYGEYIGILIAITVVIKIGFIYLMKIKSRGESYISSPEIEQPIKEDTTGPENLPKVFNL